MERTDCMIKIREGESLDSALKRFKKQVQKFEIIKDYKRHQYYESKSLKRKRKHENYLKRKAKEERKSQRFYQPSAL